MRAYLDQLPGLVDVTDWRPLPGIEWRMKIDREQAGRFGADIALVGSFLQLVTNGILIGDYRPDDADDEVDIRARFPEDARSLGQFERLRVNTPYGAVPIASFVERAPAPRVGTIARVDGRRALDGHGRRRGRRPGRRQGARDQGLARRARRSIRRSRSRSRARIEEQKESEAFLSRAFVIALFLIAIILVTQFNSFYQTLLILTRGGVLDRGRAPRSADHPPAVRHRDERRRRDRAGRHRGQQQHRPDRHLQRAARKRGLAPFDAVLRTGAQRLRPVLLTTVTTILGLLPMVLKVNIDLVSRAITVGGPSTDWWAQLASAVAGGLDLCDPADPRADARRCCCSARRPRAGWRRGAPGVAKLRRVPTHPPSRRSPPNRSGRELARPALTGMEVYARRADGPRGQTLVAGKLEVLRATPARIAGIARQGARG